jgi:hypothetical protein
MALTGISVWEPGLDGAPGADGAPGPQGEPAPAGPVDGDGFGTFYTGVRAVADVAGCPAGEIRFILTVTGEDLYPSGPTACQPLNSDPSTDLEWDLPPKAGAPLSTLYQTNPPVPFQGPPHRNVLIDLGGGEELGFRLLCSFYNQKTTCPQAATYFATPVATYSRPAGAIRLERQRQRSGSRPSTLASTPPTPSISCFPGQLGAMLTRIRQR